MSCEREVHTHPGEWSREEAEALAEAWRTWLASPDGRASLAGGVATVFQENRLRCAFMAGARAAAGGREDGKDGNN